MFLAEAMGVPLKTEQRRSPQKGKELPELFPPVVIRRRLCQNGSRHRVLISGSISDEFMKAETPAPTQEDLRKLAEELIREQNTMTLSTAAKDVAWAAPVYYANLGFRFYFFSDPSSRHIQEALASRQVSAAIFHQSSTWKEIRGIQMSGTLHPLSPGLESLRALRAYLGKFSFTQEFFGSGDKMDLDGFAKRFRVRFYRFQPALLYYMDNRIRFSFRESLKLP